MSSGLTYLAERFPRSNETGAQHAGFVPGARGRFERIVQRHHARLRRATAGMLADPDRVDDVLQEAYLRAYRRLPRRFANEAHEAAWLYRVLFNCCQDELRRRGRSREEPAADVELRQAAAESAVTGREVVDAFRRLAVDDRALLLLVDVLGLEYKAAADIVGVPRGTLAWRLSVARGRLREALVLEGVRDV